jgi:hypothetical protein
MATHKEPEPPCHFLSLSTELRVLIYEYLFSTHNDQYMSVDIWEGGRASWYSHTDLYPPNIRYVCKQTYAESTDVFFRYSKIGFCFSDVTLIRPFFASIGMDNRRRLRHLCVQYHTLGEDGDVREDLDPQYWSAVAEALESSLSNDNLVLETLELETADDRDAAVRFGGSPPTDPRLLPIASMVRVIKMAEVFPSLTRLVLEDEILLQPEGEEGKWASDKLPILNFMRRSS